MLCVKLSIYCSSSAYRVLQHFLLCCNFVLRLCYKSYWLLLVLVH